MEDIFINVSAMTKIRINYNVVCKNCEYFNGFHNYCVKYHVPTRGDDWGCNKHKKNKRGYLS